MKEKTYGELYKEFLSKVRWVSQEKEELVEDFRPSATPYIDDLICYKQSNVFIENGIVVWLKDGSTIIYVGKDE